MAVVNISTVTIVACVQIWKRLVHQTPDLSDLDAIDTNFARFISKLRSKDVSPAVRKGFYHREYGLLLSTAGRGAESWDCVVLQVTGGDSTGAAKLCVPELSTLLSSSTSLSGQRGV